MKILIVEDEVSISEVVGAYAKRDGYDVIFANDGEEALEKFANNDVHLIILDLMLPKISGEEVCRRIRETSNVPIIMLTAKTSESDVVYGLDTGANDYVAKPFSPRVLMARIRAQLRPKEFRDNIASGTFADGRLEIDPERVEIRKDGVALPVTKNEFFIFSTLVSKPIRTWSREEIIRTAFGDDYDGFDRTIDTYIKTLRKKLSEPGHENGWIKTVHGFGYRFDDGK